MRYKVILTDRSHAEDVRRSLASFQSKSTAVAESTFKWYLCYCSVIQYTTVCTAEQ